MKTKKSGIVEELKEKHKKRLARAQQELKRRMAKPGKRFDIIITLGYFAVLEMGLPGRQRMVWICSGQRSARLDGRAGRIFMLAGNTMSGF